MKIRVAISIEQIGSAMYQPKFSISNEDTITPTLPIVSAKTWRKTPENKIKIIIYFNSIYKRLFTLHVGIVRMTMTAPTVTVPMRTIRIVSENFLG